MAPTVRQSFHLLWRSSGATAGASSGFVPDGQLLWELTRPYCGLSRCADWLPPTCGTPQQREYSTGATVRSGPVCMAPLPCM